MGENGGSSFKSILDSEKYSLFSFFSDAKLMTEDGSTFDIHRIILAAKSTYFQTLFCGISGEDKREFLIPGISGECLNDVLCYIYTGDITLVKGNAPELLIASDYLLLNDLYDELKEVIKGNVTMDNCLKLLSSAEIISDVEIFRESLRFIEIHFEEVINCHEHEFGYLPLKAFKHILRSTSLHVRNEKTVWLSIVYWVQQPDVSDDRLCHVPDLLTYLAYKDMDEETPTEILEHNIIINNAHLENFNMLQPEKDTVSNIIRLQKFLTKIVGLERNLLEYRAPPRLHLIVARSTMSPGAHLYITYDENLDLWRKISDIDFFPFCLLNIGFDVYVFQILSRKFLRIDLRTKELVQATTNSRHRCHCCVTEHEGRIYLFSESISAPHLYMVYHTCEVEIYDPVANTYFVGTALSNIESFRVASVRKGIYLVGFKVNSTEMTAYAYETESQTWTPIPAPRTVRFPFLFFEYHDKLFVVGNDRKADVFDLDSQSWTTLDDLPFECHTSEMSSTCLNDKLFLYDNDLKINSNIMCWNDEIQKWEKLKTSDTFEVHGKQMDTKYYHHIFCTVNDVEVVRFMSRENREQMPCFERSHFDLKGIFQREWFMQNKANEI